MLYNEIPHKVEVCHESKTVQDVPRVTDLIDDPGYVSHN